MPTYSIQPRKFSPGDRVRPLETTVRLGDRRDQVATVLHYDRSGYVWVEFADGERDNFSEVWLDHVTE